MDPTLVIGLKAIGAGLAMLAGLGAGIGIGLVGLGALLGMARNPAEKGNLQTVMILGIVFTETIAIYGLVIALLILFAL